MTPKATAKAKKQKFTVNTAYLDCRLPVVIVDGPRWCSVCKVWYECKAKR